MVIDFEERLFQSKSKRDLAVLAYDCIWSDHEEYHLLPYRISRLLDAGIDINDFACDDEPWTWELLFTPTKYHLKAAKIIFERNGVPDAVCDGESFFDYLNSAIRFDSYSNSYRVRLFLLVCAYMENSPSCLKMMNDNNVEILKYIDKFDYCVEFEKQASGFYGCWKMHIFDRKSKIEVAQYY